LVIESSQKTLKAAESKDAIKNFKILKKCGIKEGLGVEKCKEMWYANLDKEELANNIRFVE
jgi:hypothetical protein